MRVFTFQTEVWLPRPQPEVFEFFSDASNMGHITPAWLRFHMLTPPPLRLRPGIAIDYKLTLRGIPVHWRSEITHWEPPHRFVDRQVHGPYRLWIHEHRFRELDGGTLCEDFVRYAPPGGALANRLFVEPDLRRIFDYRRQRLQELLGREGPGNPL